MLMKKLSSDTARSADQLRPDQTDDVGSIPRGRCLTWFTPTKVRESSCSEPHGARVAEALVLFSFGLRIPRTVVAQALSHTRLPLSQHSSSPVGEAQ
jgi:hypothetical protein